MSWSPTPCSAEQLSAPGAAVGRPGIFFAPKSSIGVAPGNKSLREETFGPVLTIATFEADEEAVTLAGDAE